MAVWDPVFCNKDGKGMPVTFKWRSLLRDGLADLKNSRDPGARLFSYEWNRMEPRLRRYVVMNKEDMFCTMNRGNEAHFFEIVTEDPINPYFDLEFGRAANPDLDPDTMLEIFITNVLLTFKKDYGIKFSRSDILILNSSSIDKVSFHLICIIPGGRCFFRNTDMKDFCKNLVRGFHPMNPQLSGLVRDMVVNKNDGGKAFIFDSSVYSPNQNFRLFFNSKLDKEERLLLYHTCDFYFSRGLEAFEPTLFADSLVTIKEDKLPAQFISKTVTLQTSLNSMEEKNIQISSEANLQVPKTVSEPAKLSSSYVKMEENLVRGDKGPYPQIFDHFDKLVKTYNPNCRVYGYQGTRSDIIVRYHVMYPMLCEFSNKFHRSNGVWYVVDTLNHKYWQRCHDVRCRETRTERPKQYPLPHHLFQKVTEPATGKDDSGGPAYSPHSESGTIRSIVLERRQDGSLQPVTVQSPITQETQAKSNIGPVPKMLTQEEAVTFLCGEDEKMALNDDQDEDDTQRSYVGEVAKSEKWPGASEKQIGKSSTMGYTYPEQRKKDYQEFSSFDIPSGYELVKKKVCPEIYKQKGVEIGTAPQSDVSGCDSTNLCTPDNDYSILSSDHGADLRPVQQKRRGFETPTKHVVPALGYSQKSQSSSYTDFRGQIQRSSEVVQQRKTTAFMKEEATVVKKLKIDEQHIRDVLSNEDLEALESYDWSKVERDQDQQTASTPTVDHFNRLGARFEQQHNSNTSEQARKVIYVVRTEYVNEKKDGFDKPNF